MTLGEFVKNYRAEHGLSVRYFASISDMSPQQIINIEKETGNDGKPLSSTYRTYQKIANAVGMDEREFMRLLNDEVLVNPSHEKIPVTSSDEDIIVLSDLSEKQQRLIRAILKLSDREASDLLPKTEELLSDPQVPGDQ